jgi:hypothetical protein
MPALISCPHCRTTHTYPDQMIGKRARCKQCLSLFLVTALTGVGTPVDDVDPQEQQVQKEAAKPKPRRRYGDDYGPEPVRRSGGSGMLIGLLVGCGVFLIVLALGGIAVAVFAWPLLTSDQPSAAAPQPRPSPAPPPVRPTDPFPPKQPAPQPPAQQKAPEQPKPPAPAEKPAFTLSNAKVMRVGARLRVTVDVRPDKGPPAPGQQFNMLIRSAGGVVYHSVVSPPRLRNGGTLNINLSGPRAANDQGPFEITLELGPPGPNVQREPVSNTVSATL